MNGRAGHDSVLLTEKRKNLAAFGKVLINNVLRRLKLNFAAVKKVKDGVLRCKRIAFGMQKAWF